MRRWTSRKLSIGALAALSALVGCVLGGPGDPGCTEDAECGEGFSCRAGACFREDIRGGAVPTDAGTTSDAAEDAADANEDAPDSADAAND